ncbi:hypothetical protein EMIHUDRAFT_455498, partial [Emiliania huxleyi CCMP1516]|uniref:Uncharacterized protein n=2 Tax=Emiliania huxleyi TaxID=2903 RepID=A0A0D3KGL6_EMIH1
VRGSASATAGLGRAGEWRGVGARCPRPRRPGRRGDAPRRISADDDRRRVCRRLHPRPQASSEAAPPAAHLHAVHARRRRGARSRHRPALLRPPPLLPPSRRRPARCAGQPAARDARTGDALVWLLHVREAPTSRRLAASRHRRHRRRRHRRSLRVGCGGASARARRGAAGGCDPEAGDGAARHCNLRLGWRRPGHRLHDRRPHRPCSRQLWPRAARRGRRDRARGARAGDGRRGPRHRHRRHRRRAGRLPVRRDRD